MFRGFLFFVCFFWSFSLHAGGLIRDAEIEGALREWVNPLIEAARLNPHQVKIYLIHDKSLNAFVTGGQNIYLHTGVIAEASDAEHVLAVFAHELGHIAGGHLARMDEDLDSAIATQLIGFLVGIGTIAAGQVQAGAATLSASQQIAERGFLSSIRKREAAADEAAVRYLEHVGKSPQGMVEFMTLLQKRSRLYVGNIDPYAVTHPLTEERIKTMRHHLLTSPHQDAESSPAVRERYRRLRAKVIGFLYKPQEVYARYSESSAEIDSRYARAIAYFRDHREADSFSLIDGLIAQEPNNPYFYELKGQFSFELGRADEAVHYYEQALAREPAFKPLLRIALAQALIEKGGREPLGRAIDELRGALSEETDNSLGWQLLSVAQGRLGRYGLSALAQAEKYILLRSYPQAIAQSKRAQDLLSDSEIQARRRAQDILSLALSLNQPPF
ncbi:MAG: M48 family metalloprotease [Alphaproteobacteria bacterium GM202ARS2]|nr:M48 family metalloprotease [Alphaproteobacteria bacterium GM202ARS2]